MAAASSYFVFTVIIVLLVSVLLFRLIYKRGKECLNCPPGSYGWPILGENIQFGLFGCLKFVQERMNKYSQDVFQTSLLGGKMAVLCGQKGNKFFFSNDTKLFTPWIPSSMKGSLFFPEFANEPLQELSAVLRSAVTNILKPETLKHDFIPVIDGVARKHVEMYWAPHGELAALPLSKKYTFELVCRLFMNIKDEQHVEKLLDHFQHVVDGFITLPIYLPGTAYSRACKRGSMLRDELFNIIKARRSKPENQWQQDLISQLILMTDEQGRYFSDREICNTLVLLLLAGYETASISITFVLKYLAEFPSIYINVLQEQMEIAMAKGPNDFLTWEDIESMKYTWNVVRESMRLMPPAPGGIRESKTEFTFAGFTIPKGWRVFWSVFTTHMNPYYFPNPEKFDPTRFEGKGPAPYTYTPFGGGRRMCPGKEYARLVILISIHNIVTRFKLEKALPDERIVYYASPTPEKGLLLRLQPHEKQF